MSLSKSLESFYSFFFEKQDFNSDFRLNKGKY